LSLPDAANVTIAFPDDGAYKRFHGKLDAFGEPVVCTKRREGNKRKVVINDGEPAGRHVVIVDDLVQTGGTLLECAKALRDAGADKVSAYVTHAVFPHDSWTKFVGTAGSLPPLEHFFITNSIPITSSKLRGVAPFEVLSIAPVIGDILGL
jgi:phosphoribosylpyrophosphate synthetase